MYLRLVLAGLLELELGLNGIIQDMAEHLILVFRYRLYFLIYFAEKQKRIIGFN